MNLYKDLVNQSAERILSNITLLKQICTKPLEDNVVMEKHLLEFDGLFAYCENTGSSFGAIHRCVFVLANFPESYEAVS